jgi:hypothetical protein
MSAFDQSQRRSDAILKVVGQQRAALAEYLFHRGNQKSLCGLDRAD